VSIVADILGSPIAQELTHEALGFAADLIRSKAAGGSTNPEADALAELRLLRAGARAGIEATWQAEADKKFGG